MNKILLIGGAPTTGKSFLARKLSRTFNLPWISTDGIREQMRKIVNKSDYNHLFDLDNNMSAEQYLRSRTADSIVEHQNQESEDVWKGVAAFLDTDYVWGNYIVEGVAILPKLVANYKNENINIKTIFLVDKNTERTREVVYSRGLWDDAKTYSDEVKPKEIEWVSKFNDYIINECHKYGSKIYEIDDRKTFLDSISKEINEWLMQ